MLMQSPMRDALFGNVPGWVRAAYGPYGVVPDVAMHFDANRYFVKGMGEVPLSSILSVSRASTGYAQTAAGVLVPFAANVPRLGIGLLPEEARTNKSTNYNANPTDLTNVTKSGDAAAVLSVVDDTAALLAAGLNNIASSGKVYKLDNSAGVAAATAGPAGFNGNTNTHSVSSYIRGGAGAIGLQDTAGTEFSTFTASGSYIRRSWVGAGGSGLRITRITANAGQIIYFILNQLEEGAFVTSPIVIAGASATRAADVPQLIGPALTAALAAKSAFFQTNGVAGTTGNNRLLSDASSNYMTFNNSTQVRIINPTGNADANAGSGNYTATAKTAFGFDASSVSAIFNAGTKVISATAWTGTAPFYIGNVSSGIRALNGYMQRFALSTIKGVFDGATAP